MTCIEQDCGPGIGKKTLVGNLQNYKRESENQIRQIFAGYYDNGYVNCCLFRGLMTS